MKSITLSLLAVLLLAACTPSENKTTTESEDAIEKNTPALDTLETTTQKNNIKM